MGGGGGARGQLPLLKGDYKGMGIHLPLQKSGAIPFKKGAATILTREEAFSSRKLGKTGWIAGGGGRRILFNLYINLACLSVCLYPINVKTAEPIGPKFFVGHHVIPGKVYELIANL